MILLLLVYRKMDVDRTENKNRVVGLREVLASLKEDKISKIYLAKDSDAAYKERVLRSKKTCRSRWEEQAPSSRRNADSRTTALPWWECSNTDDISRESFYIRQISQGGNKWQQSIS